MNERAPTVQARALAAAGSRRGRFYLFLIVGLLALMMVGQIVMVVVASRDPSFSLEPDYYRKALGYDAHMQQTAKNHALGWRMEVLAFGDDGLRARLVDGAGSPVDGATVEVEAFPVARGLELRRTALLGQGAGVYGAAMASLRKGLWELRFTADARGERFTQTAREELKAAPAQVTR